MPSTKETAWVWAAFIIGSWLAVAAIVLMFLWLFGAV